MITVRINKKDGNGFVNATGRTAASILRREFGKEARLHPNLNLINNSHNLYDVVGSYKLNRGGREIYGTMIVAKDDPMGTGWETYEMPMS